MLPRAQSKVNRGGGAKKNMEPKKGIPNDCHIAKHKHIKSFFQLHLNLQDTMGHQLHLNLQDTIQDKKVINIGYLLGSLLPCIKLRKKKKKDSRKLLSFLHH